MKKRSGRIITLLAALSTAAALSVATFAGVPDTKSDWILQAAQTTEKNSGKDYIKILSPSDEEVFYQGKNISYSVNETGSFSNYTTRPYITLVLENKADPSKNKHIHDFTFPQDLANGQKGTFNGKIETERLSPGTYYFGVINWPSKDGKRLTEQEVKDLNLNPPLLAIEIEIKEHKTHSWDSGKITKPATCTEAGEKTFTCTLCETTRTEPIPATGHTWIITTAPDVGEAGVITYTCATCKATKTEDVQATIQKKPASVRVKAGKKGSVTVSWKKIKKSKKNKELLKKIQSVEVQYSTDPAFKKENRQVRTVGKRKTKVSLRLKRKTTYYFRVRYVVRNGGTSYWSNTKRVTTR